jgi:hypothetical protein
MLKANALIVKTEMDRRREQAEQETIEAQNLPDKGMVGIELQAETTEAAIRWANAYGWKEAIEYTYLISNDWRIKHHVLTGIVTGRVINGIIVMKRNDGLCSVHYALFGEDYDGSGFVNTHMVGLTPGQIKLTCDKI